MGQWVIDSYLESVAARDAAEIQAEQAGRAMRLQEKLYNQNRADQMPWMQAGQQALGNLMQLSNGQFDTAYQGMDPSALKYDPGYQFRMAEGQKALERSAAAKGRLGGGGFAKALTRYAQGTASDEYGKAWSRNMGDFQAQQSENTGRYKRFYDMAVMGQNAATGMGTQASNYGNSMSSLYGDVGNAYAAQNIANGQGAGGIVRGGVNIAMLGVGNGAGAGYTMQNGGGGAPAQSGGRY